MRRLKSTDLFSAMRFVKAAGLKNKVSEIALKARKNGGNIAEEELGADLIVSFMEAAAEKSAEEKFYEFISGPFEKSVEEIKDMELLELLDMFKQMKDIEDAEGWINFFTSLANLMK